MSATFKGRRLPDLAFRDFHPDTQPGDYWKILDSGTGEPRKPDPPQPTNLTGTCWYVIAPTSMDEKHGLMLGRLEAHTVREEDDGTISVRPNDGSSNSILISSHWKGETVSWHGYIEHGVWSEA